LNRIRLSKVKQNKNNAFKHAIKKLFCHSNSICKYQIHVFPRPQNCMNDNYIQPYYKRIEIPSTEVHSYYSPHSIQQTVINIHCIFI